MKTREQQMQSFLELQICFGVVHDESVKDAEIAATKRENCAKKFHCLQEILKYYPRYEKNKNSEKEIAEIHAIENEQRFGQEGNSESLEEIINLVEKRYCAVKNGVHAIGCCKSENGLLYADILEYAFLKKDESCEPAWEHFKMSRPAYFIKQKRAIERLATIMFGAPSPEDEVFLHLLAMSSNSLSEGTKKCQQGNKILDHSKRKPSKRQQKAIATVEWMGEIVHILEEYKTWEECSQYVEKHFAGIFGESNCWEVTLSCQKLASLGLLAISRGVSDMMDSSNEKTRVRGQILQFLYIDRQSLKIPPWIHFEMPERTYYREKKEAQEEIAEILITAQQSNIGFFFNVLDFFDNKNNKIWHIDDTCNR